MLEKTEKRPEDMEAEKVQEEAEARLPRTLWLGFWSWDFILRVLGPERRVLNRGSGRRSN